MVLRSINLEEANKELSKLNIFERVIWAHDRSPRMIVLTSGGKKYPLVPHIVRSALPNESIPIVFIDIECYDPGTYRAIEELKKEGYDIRTYRPKLSLTHDEAIYGRIYNNGNNDIDVYRNWCIRRKKEPLDLAIQELRPDFIIGGRTKFQSSKRQTIECLEKRGDLCQFNPIFDWDKSQISEYLTRFNLKGNDEHKDPTKGFDAEECPIWNYQI